MPKRILVSMSCEIIIPDRLSDGSIEELMDSVQFSAYYERPGFTQMLSVLGRNITNVSVIEESSSEEEEEKLRPRTIEEAVEILKKVISPLDLQDIADTQPKSLIKYHTGLGKHIRNMFGLWTDNTELVAATGKEHPDDASGVIIHNLWQSLQKKEDYASI